MAHPPIHHIGHSVSNTQLYGNPNISVDIDIVNIYHVV